MPKDPLSKSLFTTAYISLIRVCLEVWGESKMRWKFKTQKEEYFKLSFCLYASLILQLWHWQCVYTSGRNKYPADERCLLQHCKKSSRLNIWYTDFIFVLSQLSVKHRMEYGAPNSQDILLRKGNLISCFELKTLPTQTMWESHSQHTGLHWQALQTHFSRKSSPS